ncbi:MAG TPA: DUF1998 domain-containing protein, partial [Hellea balneolensis]|nr:DUF1998 domain-containing protein [Hellea balneolensis]
MNSAPIVQRHINSLLLSTFFADELSEHSFRLETGAFFLPGEDGQSSRAKRFLDWCERVAANSSDHPELEKGVHALKHGTILEGSKTSRLIHEAQSQLEKLDETWRLEHQNLSDQLEELKSELKDEEHALRAIEFQMRRMTEEYLLSELAARAFLPGYGFPLHVAGLNTLTIEEFKRQKDDKNGREDNRLRSRNEPARDAATAIREYAPGADIVLDGKVYKSCGLSLTWKKPVDAEVKEPQEFRLAWRCRKCGTAGTQRNGKIDELTCSNCGSGDLDIRRFIQPGGYTVDFYDKPHNDVTKQTFMPVKEPWVFMDDPWRSLPDPDLGRIRTSRKAQIFWHSSGLHNHGYALCLGCGRADSQTAEGELPEIFTRPHHSPRYKKSGDMCPGNDNDWLIKRDLHLGFESQTDAFELQLRDGKGHLLEDEQAAYSLAIALKGALASLLGIEEQELGFVVARRKEGQQSGFSLILYDSNSGGSGYASQAGHDLAELLKKAEEILQCKAECDAACGQCLMSYDTRFYIDKLNRKKALSFLQEIKLHDRLALPEKYRFFGKASMLESCPLEEAIQQAFRALGSDQVNFYVTEFSEDMDLREAWFFGRAFRWAASGRTVRIMIVKTVLDKLLLHQRLSLLSLIGVPNIEVLVLADKARFRLPFDGIKLSEVVSTRSGSREIRVWGTSDKTALLPNKSWGNASNAPVIRGDIVLSETSMISDSEGMDRLSEEDLIKTQNGDSVIEIHRELDGAAKDFGKKFWDILEQDRPDLLKSGR